MRLKSLLLTLAAALAVSATPLGTADKADARLHTRSYRRPASVPVDIPGVRGNIPDITDLEHDIVLEEHDLSALGSRQTNLIDATDNLLFSVSLASFLSAKQAQNPAGLDWSDDGCSASPDKPLGFNFLDSCKRHDFGYRNYKAQGRFTEPNRGKIDGKLMQDLTNECNKLSVIPKAACLGVAEIYYEAVRKFGNL